MPLPDSLDPPVDGAWFQLSGPAPRPDPARVPLRGDLAHIALAGRYFVPHYAAPQPRTIADGGAAVLAAAEEDAEVLARLDPGATFDVLDVAGGWAWGCVAPDGPVGYVALDRLARPAP